MKERIVVTGIGAISSLGLSVDDTWAALKRGESGVGPITRFDASQHATRIAAEVKGFDPKKWMDGKDARKMDLFSQFACAGTAQALADAGLAKGSFDPERIGVNLGIGIGGLDTIEQGMHALFEKGPGRIQPMAIPKFISNLGSGNVAIVFDLRGPCYCVTTACSSGTDAIGQSAAFIRAGLADVMITGGVESSITSFGIGAFNVIQALSTKSNDRPERASRPFDKDRDGFVMGEGAGILVLESLEHARARGARIRAELAGYGATCDANHMTAPHPEGRGAVRAMQIALADAGFKPEDVDYINAHGTSTPINDPIETAAVKQAFGEHARRLKISSTKSMLGHCLGAAGGIEAIICIKAIEDQFFPATINLDQPDPACDLDYVPNQGVSGRIRAAMSNTFGFGGHNGIIIVKECN